MQRFYSTSQAAKFCQVSKSSVLRWIQEGRLKAATTLGGHNRIQAEHLINFLNELGIPAFEMFQQTFVPVKHVLIVDDDPDICALVKKGLSRLSAKMEFQIAHDGLQAGWKLSKFVPDLVVLDLHLPQVDGYQVCKLLRSEPTFKNTKILAISTYDQVKKEKILGLGADYFLSKPFKLQDIEETVRLLFEEKKPNSIRGEAA